MTDAQRKALERLWFIYGNYGPKHTWGNHKFLQILIERGGRSSRSTATTASTSWTP